MESIMVNSLAKVRSPFVLHFVTNQLFVVKQIRSQLNN